MGNLDPKIAGDFERAWLEHWELALNKARDGNPHWVHAMLATEHPVPAHIARKLLYLKAPRGAPRAIAESPEDVVRAVYHAIADGHKFSTTEGTENYPAFKEVARQLHCKPRTIQRRWKECPEPERRNIQCEVEVSRGLLERLESD
jgi:hypothetical protein